MTFFAYSDLMANGILDSEPNACHFLISKKILPTRRTCPICSSEMAIKSCSTTQYSDGFCWKCTCGCKISVRQHSILENKQTPFRTFLGILYCYSSRMTPAIAAEQQQLDQRTVKQYYTMIREKMTEEINTSAGMIGGPNCIVQMDEAKFGKQKFHRGRLVNGYWVLGGVDQNTGHAFFEVCPNNRRDEATLLPIIQRHILPGTIIVTDGWAAYQNLGQHGYTHFTVNHTTNFVSPVTGAHTNAIEGLWTRLKRHTGIRNGGRRTSMTLQLDITEYAWLKQKGATTVSDMNKMFSMLLPELLYYRNWC